MNILLLRLSALGDVIHTLPAVSDLRASIPEARIAWVVEAAYAGLVQAVAPVDRVIPVQMKRWRKELLARETREAVAALRRSLREAALDGVSIDGQGLVKSGALARLSGARLRFGFDWQAIREKAALAFINRPVAIPRSLHVVEINRALVRGVIAALGRTPLEGTEPDLLRFAAAEPSPELRARMAGRPVALLPGAGRADKRWNIDRFQGLARHIANEYRAPITVLWGPGEDELARAIAAGSPAVAAPRTDLGALTWALSQARVVVAGDTGPLHLAAALGTPVVGLYGPTDPARNGPWGQLDRVVSRFPAPGVMESIPVGEVAERVGDLLE